MKGYVKPEIIQITDMMEMSDLNSGFSTTDLLVTLRWASHDSGSLSTLWVGLYRHDVTKNHLKVVLSLAGAKRYIVSPMYAEKDWFKITVSSDRKQMTIETKDAGLPPSTPDFQFNLDMTFEPGPYAEGTWSSVGHITEGSYGQPVNDENGAVRKDASEIPYVGEDKGTAHDGQGNAQGSNGWFLVGKPQVW